MALTTDQGLILPDGPDNANVPLTFTDFVTTAGSGIENRLVKRYLSVADRTARNPAPNEGELSYLNDLNRYETFEPSSASWIPLYSNAVAFDATSFTTTSAAFTTVGGALVGGTVVVPASGMIEVVFRGDLDHSSATGQTHIAPQLNAGAVVGAGATITAAADDMAITAVGTDLTGYGAFGYYTGLTPGAAVNVFLMHRTNAATATIARRRILIRAFGL